MYNLFVTAQDGAWDRPFYEYDRSRFLEYTSEKISESFTKLTPRIIAKLKAMPCLFAYEGSEGNVRIGRLTSVKERGRKLLIEYKFDPDTPAIPFADIKPIATLLDIRDWEMNRTHWAIKDEDLLSRLKAHAIISEETSIPQEAAEVIETLPEKKASTPRITTVKGFIEKVLSEQRDASTLVFYRGHSDKKNYKLEPSLFRKDKDGN